jgi:hypothetical protein
MIVVWVLLGAVVGGMLGGTLGDASAGHPGDIAAIAGGLAIGAPIGAICAGLAGAALGRKYPAGSPTRKRLVAATWIAPVVLVLGGWLFETARTWDDLVPGGGAPWLWYEVNLPPRTPAPSAGEVVAEFYTDKETRKQPFPGHGIEVEQLADRAVIRGSFETYKTARRRILRLRIGDGPTHVFELKLLPSRPPAGYSDGYSDWHGAESVEEVEQPPRPPQPGENLEIRYKMDVV